MNILIVHEIDWIRKVAFEPHHLAELFSIRGNAVFVIDCAEPNIRNFLKGLHTSTVSRYNRIYDEASITLIRPPSLLIKGLNRASHFLTCTKIIKKTIIEKKIDIILLYGVATNGIQTIKVANEMKIPVIFRSLDIAHGLVKIPVLRQLSKRYESKVMKNAAKVLGTTPELTRYAIEMGAKREKVEHFSLGINARDFKPMNKDSQLATSLGISEQDSVVVFIGTIYDFAGLDEMMMQFHILLDKMNNIKFLIVGGGPYFEKINSLVKERKLESHVILTGFKPQKDLPKYISLADICVNPFIVNYVTDRIIPTKILEYFACAKPVLSTPLRGTKELLPSEEFGIIYSSSDMFVDTLAELLENKPKLNDLGKKGYEYVKEHHDWNILSNKLLEKFEKLITKN